MDTFILRISKVPAEVSPGESAPAADALGRALSRVLRALPDLGMPFDVVEGPWRGKGLLGDWALTRPQRGSSLVSVHETERLGILLFGEVFGEAEPIDTLTSAFLSGGANAVRALDGCFGVIIWDKHTAKLSVVSDLIGQRALRFAETNDALWLSPHDTCLVAAGAVTVEFDPVSALSCLVLENSLQARSVLRGVTGLEGNVSLTWSANLGVQRAKLPKLDLQSRISPKDQDAQRACRDSVIERIVAASTAWANSVNQIRCELTAGIDSRATLACLLAARVDDKVLAVTSGAPDTVDMRTAVQLAKLAGIRHEVLPASSEDPNDFIANLRLRAFANNGESDGKRATKRLPTWRPDEYTRVEGTSGEIFRGFYYPYFGPTGIAPDSVDRVVSVLLARRARRFSVTPVAAPEYRGKLRERLEHCFQDYAEISHNGNDLLDLFYLFERTAHWSAHVRRGTWSSTRNVFLVPSAVREAYRLPSPWGTTVNIHAPLIKRYFPASRWVLINGAKPLDLEGPGRLRTASRLALTAGQAVFERAAKRLRGKPTTSGAAQLFAGALLPVLRDLMTPVDSVTTQTLGEVGTKQILKEHANSQKHAALLGYAATLEAFRLLLNDVRPDQT